MCGETRDRVDFGPLHQGPRNPPPLPPYIQPLGHRLDLGNDSSVHENMMLPKLDTFVDRGEGPDLSMR